MKQAARELLEQVARRHLPDEVDLYPALLARLQRQRRQRWALALVTLALVLTAAAYMVGRSLGYLPGVGVVNPGEGLLMLATPVSQTQQGLTLQITQGVADAHQTVLTYRLSDEQRPLPPPPPPTGEQPRCTETPYLRLPGGVPLPMEREEGAGVSGRWVFPPLPKGVSQVELVVPCLLPLPPTTPRNWRLTLRFVPAPADLTLIPVSEVPVPTLTPAPGSTEKPGAQPPITVHAMRLGERYVLFGDIRQPFGTLEGITVTDARGQRVPLLPPDEVGLGDYRWQIAFAAEGVQFPVDLTFRWVPWTFEEVAPPVVLKVPLGEHPSPDQTWRLEQPFTVGGYTLTLQSVQASGEEGYTFTFLAPAEVLDVDFEVEGARTVGSSGSMRPLAPESAPAVILRTLVFDRRPTGTLHLKVTGLIVRQDVVDVHVRWVPESTLTPTPAADTATPPEVCLTVARWQQLLPAPPNLPPLPGKMVYSRFHQGAMLPDLLVSKPDGTQVVEVGPGAWPGLSPEGDRLLYGAREGWVLLNLETGERRSLLGDGRHPIWSPEGQRVLFGWGLGLYVMDLPQGERTLVTQGIGGPVEPVGWSEEAGQVLYTALEGGAFHLRRRDLRTGTREDLGLTFNNKAGYAALSPDGRWVAFADLNGGTWGLYLAHPDGSARRLVVSPEVPLTFEVAWSPDGQWMVVNTFPEPQQAEQERARPLVLDPFTCEAYLLPWRGLAEGWGP
jgi:Periplasmic component of the Tol biopolymer transport system